MEKDFIHEKKKNSSFKRSELRKFRFLNLKVFNLNDMILNNVQKRVESPEN